MALSSNTGLAPIAYEDAAILALEVGQEMLSRLELMALKPSRILCLGRGSVLLREQIKRCCPGAEIIEYAGEDSLLDVAQAIESLALSEQSVDFIFANFFLPWVESYEQSLSAFRKLLRPDGLLMLTALGPNSFTPYLKALEDKVLPKGIDMHDLGDMMMRSGLAEPVLDVSDYALAYRQADKMLAELVASDMLDASAINLRIDPSEQNQFVINFEIIHAHAFAPLAAPKMQQATPTEVSIPVSQIKFSKN